MLLFYPNQLTGCGALSPASAPRLRVAGQVLFTLLLLLLPFLQPAELCLGPHIPFPWSGTPPILSWCSVRTSAFVDVFLMHPHGQTTLSPSTLPPSSPSSSGNTEIDFVSCSFLIYNPWVLY